MKIKKWKDMSKKERAKLILTILQGIAILILCGVMIWGIVNTFTNKGEASAEEIAADVSTLSSQPEGSAELRPCASDRAETIGGEEIATGISTLSSQPEGSAELRPCASDRAEITGREYEIMPISTSTLLYTTGEAGFKATLTTGTEQYKLRGPTEQGLFHWTNIIGGAELQAGTLTLNDIIEEGLNPEDFQWYQLATGYQLNGQYGTFSADGTDSLSELSEKVKRLLIIYNPADVPPTPPTYYNVVFQTTGLAEDNPSFIGDLPRMQVETGTTITIPVMKAEGYSVSVNIFEASTGSGQSWPITSFPKQYEVNTNVTITYNFDAQEAKTTYEQGYSDGYETGTGQGYNSGYDNGYTEGQSAGYQNGYNAGLSATNTFTWDWLINFTNGLFSANLFGQISLGTVVMAMIAIAVLGGLLKLFFGG